MKRVGALAAGLVLIGAAQAPISLGWEPQQSGVTARLRGISAVSATVAWASGSGGTVLRTVDGGRTWQKLLVPAAEKLDFRDIEAFNERVAYALSIGSGESSRIYKTTDGGATWTLQFQNVDPKAFLDDMNFLDESRGIAFSDSVDGALVLFRTDDGRGWRRVSAEGLPPALPGEGAFAASGTNIAIAAGGRVWVGTGASRVLQTRDGRTWKAVAAPLATSPTAGIFSIAFRDTTHGVVVGGDYAKESEAVDNAAFTADGGATWTLVREKGLSGFRSVVAPLVDATWLAIGPAGSDLSTDDGRTWRTLASDGFDTFSAAPGARTGWAAGSGGRISRVSW